jgi:hypothetical protein
MRFASFQTCEKIYHRHTECFRNPNDCGEPEIFSPGFKMSDKGSVQLAVVRKFFLRLEAPPDADLPNALSKTPKEPANQ